MKKQKQNKQSEMQRLFFSVCSAISADLFVPASDSAPFRSTEVLLGGNWSCEEDDETVCREIRYRLQRI